MPTGLSDNTVWTKLLSNLLARYLFEIDLIESIVVVVLLLLGSYCPDPAGPPILCPPGYANDKHGSTECSLCPPGTYADVAGLAHCLTCPPGYYCGSARMAPVRCPSNLLRGQTECSDADK